MALELRPWMAVAALVAVLVIGAVGSIALTEATDQPTTGGEYVSLDETEQQLWAYTTVGKSFDRPTLAINAIVYGNPTDVRQQFLTAGPGDWNLTDEGEEPIGDDPGETDAAGAAVEWDLTTGSSRYVHLSGGETGRWLTADYQIHDGEYLGSRHHLRAYTDPDGIGEWTAIQAHHEHWDWFTGRHVVTSVVKAQSYLEREFVAGSSVAAIQRVPVGTGDSSIERWVTVVDLRSTGSAIGAVLPIAFLGAFVGRLGGKTSMFREWYPKQDLRTLSVGVGIAGLLLGLRLLGIRLERAFSVPPKTFAFALYPLLFVGLPVVTYLLARPLDRSRAFIGGSLGFVAGALLDYSLLGVTHLPLDMLVFRGTLAVALGLIAAGSSRSERRDRDRMSHVRLGVLLWLVATLLPLLRHTPLPV